MSTGMREIGAVLLCGLAACQGPKTLGDSGLQKSDSGHDSGVVVPILCTLTDSTECTLDAGGYGVCCNGACVQTETDSANCDQCGRVCPAPSVCTSSTCLAGGIVGTCADGGCPSGLGCAGGYFCATLTCPAAEVGGQCALTDGGSGTCCSGDCSDLLIDDDSCGQCGHVCLDGGYCASGGCIANPDCASVTVGAVCRLSSTSIGRCCGGICADLDSATTNCGACGSNCPVDATCTQGVCLVGDGGATCGGDEDGGGTCASGSSCIGDRCLSAVCVATEPGAMCSLNLDGGAEAGTCCGGTCTNLATDPRNCGSCGHACDGGTCDGFCRVTVPDAGPDGGASGPDGGSDAG